MILPSLTPQVAIFGITNEFTINRDKLLENHILLIFTINIYYSWKKHKLDINTLLNNIAKVKKVEKILQVIMRRKSQLIIEKALAIKISLPQQENADAK